MSLLPSTVVLGLIVLQAAPPPAARSRHATGDARKLTLVLPHALRMGETAWLLVRLGAIDHNEVRITTQEGRLLGAISPSDVRSGKPAGTYTIPVPPEAFHNGRLALRISVVQSGRATRAPTKEEVRSVRLLIRRFRTASSRGPNP